MRDDGGNVMFDDDGDPRYYAPPTEYENLQQRLEATRVMDPVSMLRDRGVGLQQHANALRDGFGRHTQNIQDQTDLIASGLLTDEQLAHAQTSLKASQNEVTTILGQVDQLDRQRGYASVANQQIVNWLVGEVNGSQGHSATVETDPVSASPHTEIDSAGSDEEN